MPSAISGHHGLTQSVDDFTPNGTSAGTKRAANDSHDDRPEYSRKRLRNSRLSHSSLSNKESIPKKLKAFRLERDVLNAQRALEHNRMADMTDEIDEISTRLELLKAIITRDDLITQHTSAIAALNALGREFGGLFEGPGPLLDTDTEGNTNALRFLKRQLESSMQSSLSQREEALSERPLMEECLEKKKQQLNVCREQRRNLVAEIEKIGKSIQWLEGVSNEGQSDG